MKTHAKYSFLILLLAAFCGGKSVAQSSMVMSGTTLRLVSDVNTKLVLTDLNLVNNAHEGAISGSPEVVYTGSNAITLSGTATTNMDKLTINNAAGVAIANPINISDKLTLTNGRISLGSNDLTLGVNASIEGTPSASNMIVAAGSGELIKRFPANESNQTPFVFPVGTTNGGNEYTPVTLDFVSGTFGSNAAVGVRVQDSKNSSLNSTITNYLNRNWIIEPNTDVSNFNYTVELKYVDADFITDNSQVEANLIPIKMSGSTWYQPADGPFTVATTQGIAGVVNTTNNILTWSGLTSFSQFGGAGGNGQPLPVELVSFSGNCEDGKIALEWVTASEHNSSHFEIEESRDGTNWNILGTKEAAGNSNETILYNYFDNVTNSGNNYYRLEQFDFDGHSKVYGPINVSCENSDLSYFMSFPNPSGSAFQVILNDKDLIGQGYLQVNDSKGSEVYHSEIELKEGINMFVVNEALSPGVYLIQIKGNSGNTETIRHVVK